MALVAAAALSFLAIMALLLKDPARAQNGGGFFPETGHAVDPVFLPFFETHGGAEILGRPITGAFLDPIEGWIVQYFENTRLEMPLGRPAPVGVRVSPIGVQLGWGEPAGSQTWAGQGCRLYDSTGHTVCHAFLDFYLQRGGVEVLGYPISDVDVSAERMVQHFENVRLEWQQSEGEVRVAPSGRAHFEALGYPRSLLQPDSESESGNTPEVERLVIQSSLSKAVTQGTDTQEVSVVVRDRRGDPARGAVILLVARFPDSTRTILLPLTDETGSSQATVSFEGQPPGTTVSLDLWAMYRDLQAMTRDSFLIWW
jgi:hypothetical protein